MNRLKLVLLFLLSLFLDLSVLSRFGIFGVAPSVAIAVIVVLSLRAKTEKITYFAIILGLIMDAYFSDVLGIRALSYYLISYYTFKNRRFEGDSFTFGLLALSISTLANTFYLFIIKSITSKNLKMGMAFKSLAKTALLELVLGVICYVLVYLFIEKVLFREKKNFFA